MKEEIGNRSSIGQVIEYKGKELYPFLTILSCFCYGSGLNELKEYALPPSIREENIGEREGRFSREGKSLEFNQ